jgi:hypothetical protein
MSRRKEMKINESQDVIDCENDPRFIKISDGLYFCADEEFMERIRSQVFPSGAKFIPFRELGRDRRGDK